jgi:hypothetical protein
MISAHLIFSLLPERVETVALVPGPMFVPLVWRIAMLSGTVVHAERSSLNDHYVARLQREMPVQPVSLSRLDQTFVP